MFSLLGLVPLIGQLLPNLVPALATPLLGNILGKAGEIAQKVFGTTDPNEISLAIQQDASKAAEFKAQLEAETAQEQALLADLQSARQQTIELSKSGSLIAWGAPVMSIIVVIGFLGALWLFLSAKLELPEFQQSVLNIMLGFLGAAFQQCVAYWLGSSRGSADKGATLARIATTPKP